MLPDDTNEVQAVSREPDRISKMATVSLLVSIFFCIPGFGFIAAVLGVVSLYRIGGSGGRLGGRTFAAVGLTIGLISTAGWLSIGLGARQAYATYSRSMATPMVEYLAAVNAPDHAAATAIFDPAGKPTPEQCGIFSKSLANTLGKAIGPVNTIADAQTMWGMRRSAVAVDPNRMYTGGPLRFEKGIAMVLFRLSPGTPATAYFPASGVDQITITLPTGEVLRLPEPVETAR